MGLSHGSRLAKINLSDTFTATGQGVSHDISESPMKHFAIQVTATGSVTSWGIRLQSSIDGISWTTIAVHTDVVGSGQTVFISSSSPSNFIRANCTALTLGLGTNIISKILGVQ